MNFQIQILTVNLMNLKQISLHFIIVNLKTKNQIGTINYQVALSDAMEEDNWKGSTGFIHQVLHDEYLSKHDDPTEVEYYMCGPPPMINAVEGMLDSLGVEPGMIAYDSFG